MTARRILFVAEAISLAHVARTTALADTLNRDEFDIHFASSGEFAFCHADRQWQFHRVHSISTQCFQRRLELGLPVYSRADLECYIADDLRLIEAVSPELIVHDFRLSMSIAARLANVPLLSLCNAHWSPYVRPMPVQAPNLPIARLLGYRLMDTIFRALWPLANRMHVAPINSVRRQYGLPPYGSLSEFYCDGDVVMYSDTAQLTPLDAAPASHCHIGSVIWSPQTVYPAWWGQAVNCRERRVYITLGSSGNTDLLPDVIAACRSAGLVCLVATAGHCDMVHRVHRPPAVYAADFLPGSESAALADFVICNGGSATSHQALAQGRAVLGICSNLDQVLTMQRIAAAGAAVFLRAGEANPASLRSAIARLIGDDAYANVAQRVRSDFAMNDFAILFGEIARQSFLTGSSQK